MSDWVAHAMDALRASCGQYPGTAFMTPQGVIVWHNFTTASIMMVQPGKDPRPLATRAEIEDCIVTFKGLAARLRDYASSTQSEPYGAACARKLHEAISDCRTRVILGNPAYKAQTGGEYREVQAIHHDITDLGTLAASWLKEFNLVFHDTLDNPFLYVRRPVAVDVKVINNTAPILVASGRYLLSSVELPDWQEAA
jgi:hypothetical protein